MSSLDVGNLISSWPSSSPGPSPHHLTLLAVHEAVAALERLACSDIIKRLAEPCSH